MQLKPKLLSLLIASVCCLTLTTWAEEESTEKDKNNSSWYVSPLGGFIQNDQTRSFPLEENQGAQAYVGFGKEVSDRFNVEFGLDANWLEGAESSTYLRSIGAEVDAQYFFNRDQRFSPYLSAGLGLLETADTDDTNPIWGAGFGLLTDIGLNQAKLRTELRYRQEIDSSSQNFDDVLFRAGVLIPFGSSESSPFKNSILRDTDGDGITDDKDKCPATPYSAVSVNSYGCEDSTELENPDKTDE